MEAASTALCDGDIMLYDLPELDSTNLDCLEANTLDLELASTAGISSRLEGLEGAISSLVPGDAALLPSPH